MDFRPMPYLRGLTACIAVMIFAAGCASDQIASPSAGSNEPEEVSATDYERDLATLNTGNENEAMFHLGTRVDRMAMPAVATAVISSKDAYNAADPTDDAAGLFVPEIVANVSGLHAALDDDLTGAGLTPASTDKAIAQAAPLVVPDVIRIDVSKPSGFPNGRRLTDPVIDVTLAVILLDLDVHPVTTLIGLNPTRNDLDFGLRFPFLAPPQSAAGVAGLLGLQ